MICRKKLKVAVVIMLLGSGSGLLFHGFQSVVLAQKYPYSTCLFTPAARFSDFYDTLRSAESGNPYSCAASPYFPLSYALLQPLCLLPLRGALVLFFSVATGSLAISLFLILEPSLRSRKLAIIGSVVLVAAAYPVWYCVDRGNIELMLAPLVCGYILMLCRGRYLSGVSFLIPAICAKLYPALFLGLLWRPKGFRYVGLAFVGCLIFSYVSLLTFREPIKDNLNLLAAQLHQFKENYAISDGGMGGSASIWNPTKLLLYALEDREGIATEASPLSGEFLSFRLALEGSGVVDTRPASAFDETLRKNLSIYSLAMFLFALGIAWHVIVIERSLFRKVLVLGLLMVLAPAAGADYKLVYITILLAVAVALKSQRRFDMAVVVLLALVLMPKKYWFFPHVLTDSGTTDCSLGVIINPLLMLTAMLLVVVDGWRYSTQKGRSSRWAYATRFLWGRFAS